jgi:hypothetical protein
MLDPLDHLAWMLSSRATKMQGELTVTFVIVCVLPVAIMTCIGKSTSGCLVEMKSGWVPKMRRKARSRQLQLHDISKSHVLILSINTTIMKGISKRHHQVVGEVSYLLFLSM